MRRQRARVRGHGNEPGVVRLADLPAGAEGEIVRVESKRRARADRLAIYGIAPGMTLTLQQKYPTFVVRVGETDLALDAEIAADILIRPRAR